MVRRVAQTRVSLLELKKQLEAREHELAEALAQQEATAEVLRAIAKLSNGCRIGAAGYCRERRTVTRCDVSKVMRSGWWQSMGHHDNGR
jgi:hypothetical protein